MMLSNPALMARSLDFFLFFFFCHHYSKVVTR